MNDYFRCAKNNGSFKSNRKLLVVKAICKVTIGSSEVSLMMFLWWKLHHEIPPKQGLYYKSSGS